MESTGTMNRIRASMLPAYNDCPRRAAARQFRREIEKAGYKLNDELPSIGAAVGTATHAVAEEYFRAKMEAREFSQDTAVESAISELQEKTKSGCIWDDTTPSIDTARVQIKRMANAYIESVGKNTIPLAVEIRIEAEISEGWILSGQIDLAAEAKDGGIHLRDIKTGAISRSHHSQLGAYSLLLRSDTPEGLPSNVSAASIDFVKRTPKRNPQEGVVTTDYDISLCEKTAYYTIQRIKTDFEKFKETNNPFGFAENSMSMLCNKTYCIAFGTEFCPITKGITEK